MEQDEDPDPHFGGRSRGDVGVRADGPGAGAAGDDANEGSVKLKAVGPSGPSSVARSAPHSGAIVLSLRMRPFHMFMKFLLALPLLLLPAMAAAADITGIPKIREGDQITIGTSRIRLGGIDAPSVDQLCLNNSGERWTCGVAARDELIKHVGNKSWSCHVVQTDRRGRQIARCEVDGEDIQKWMVKSGWALAYVRFSHDYDADEKAARDAKAGMWQGAFIAPWDWRVRNKKTTLLRDPQGARHPSKP